MHLLSLQEPAQPEKLRTLMFIFFLQALLLLSL